MNRLKSHTAYLAGAIDKVTASDAMEWREDMTDFLNDLGIGVFNPCDKPIYNTTVHEDNDFVSMVEALKDRGNYDEVQKIMQEIVRIDLNFVDLCNFMILNIEPDCHMCGSYGEQTVACLQRKPIIIHCSKGISKIPNWLFGVCDPKMFFESWIDVKGYIKDICYDVSVDDNDKKWRFIDYHKAFGKRIRAYSQ